ncbi:hypothetical protein NHQ30_007898 [Ciborinia camelliae]|nr:hypothetical protein NHQ30_007898 [Ciborinia camelliae]
MFSSKSGPSMAWFWVLLHLASLITFSAAKPTRALRNGTSLLPRLINEYRVRECIKDQEKAIEIAIDEVGDVVYSVITRITNLQDKLQVGEEVTFSEWSKEVWSTYDTFQTLFGYQLYVKSDDGGGSVDEASLEVLGKVKLAFQELSLSLFDIEGKSLDVWCGSDWELETDDEGNFYTDAAGNEDTSYLWDNSGNGFGWIIPDPVDGPIVCTNSYMTTPAGFTINSNGVSIITLCDAEILRIITEDQTLGKYRETVFAEDAIFLNNIVGNALSFVLIHEFSHAQALMGEYFTIDVELANGQPAYGWAGAVALGSDSELKSLTVANADTLALFAAAMYLSQNTWWDGQSKDLSYSSEWVEAISFLDF